MIPSGCTVCQADVYDATLRFFDQFKVRPAKVRMTAYDMTNFMKTNQMGGIMTLEANKKYSSYVQTGFGPIELDLLEDDQTALSSSFNTGTNMVSHSVIVVENFIVDQEFEKHVLNKEEES